MTGTTTNECPEGGDNIVDFLEYKLRKETDEILEEVHEYRMLLTEHDFNTMLEIYFMMMEEEMEDEENGYSE